VLKLQFSNDKDYSQRFTLTQTAGILRSPDVKEGTPLQVLDRESLTELSFGLFVGWIFTGILNREKRKLGISIIPATPSGDISVLALYDPTSGLITPQQTQEGILLDPDYFSCPLDKIGLGTLSPPEMRLCPVVNKIRFNLGKSRSDLGFAGIVEPHKTLDCCESRKAKLWGYLNRTVVSEPTTYGSIVGGAAVPIRVSYEFLGQYLTGTGSNDFGTLLEETLLWLAGAASKCLRGFPHVTIEKPMKSNEIDILLYDEQGKDASSQGEPISDATGELDGVGVCIIELSLGHPVRYMKKGMPNKNEEVSIAETDRTIKSKLINFLALEKLGLGTIHGHYLSMTGESALSGAADVLLRGTENYNFCCIGELVGGDIVGSVLNHLETPVDLDTLRIWHSSLVRSIEEAAVAFGEARGLI